MRPILHDNAIDMSINITSIEYNVDEQMGRMLEVVLITNISNGSLWQYGMNPEMVKQSKLVVDDFSSKVQKL